MSRRKVLKIKAVINEIESKRTMQKINESNSLLFKKINKIAKPLTRLMKKNRGRTQINKIRNERREITTHTKEIQRIVRKYYENHMPTNWTTWMKWINSLKHKIFQK